MENNTHAYTDQPDFPDLGDPNESLPQLLATCVKHIRDSLNARFAESGNNITSEQWMVLTVLSQQDGISQLDLAKRIDRTEVSALNLLKKLESKEYVLRQRDPIDARCNRIFLTSAGRKLQRQLVPVALANRAKICTGLNDDDVKNLKRFLNIMIHNTKMP